MSSTLGRPGRWLLPVVADLVCVLAFAIGGKSSHEAGRPDWVVLLIVWPFATAAVVAHVGLLARGRSALPVRPEGLLVLAVTYVAGMAPRVVSGRGVAPGFLVVAAVFLALTLLGWRAVFARVARRRTAGRPAARV